MGLIALILYTVEVTGQGLAVALLLLAGDFVPALIGPISGVVTDRFDRKAVMIICEIISGGIFAAIALMQPPFVVLLVLIGIQSMVGQVFGPASRSVVPQIVPSDHLATANAILRFGSNGLEVMGPVIGSVLLHALGIRFVLGIDAATFIISSVLLMDLPQLKIVRISTTSHSWFGQSVAGLSAVWQRPIVFAVGAGFFMLVAFNGVDDVALPFLGRQLGAGDAGISLLYAASGIGLTVSLAILTRGARIISPLIMVVVGFGLSSAGNLFTGLAWAVVVAFAMQSLRGVGIALQDLGVDITIQRAVPTEFQGRVFGNVYGSLGVAAGLSYVIGGALVDVVGPRVAFMAAGAGGVATALGLAAALNVIRKRTGGHTS